VSDAQITEASREFHFRDSRPPHEVQAFFEGVWTAVLRPEFDGTKLVFRGAATLAGCPYSFALAFDAVLPRMKCYTLRIDASWANLPAAHHDYFRRSFDSWMQFWTKPLSLAPKPDAGQGVGPEYSELVQNVFSMEAQLSTVEVIQQQLLSRMRKGAELSTAHKEGGTVIRWQGSCFTRSDFGESDEREVFADDALFLAFVRKFFDSRVCCPDRVPELDAWRLILRQLYPRN
jgi:hypothetical protein